VRYCAFFSAGCCALDVSLEGLLLDPAPAEPLELGLELDEDEEPPLA
jgi:hypothetical protein